MVILWRLLFGHLLADFTFQSDAINAAKRTSLKGMLAHCAAHPLCYAVLAFPFLGEIWIDQGVVRLSGWACVLLVFVAHFIEDQWRVFTIFRHRVPDNTLYFLWDQVIHYAVIFAVVPSGLSGFSELELMPEKWPVLGCLAVLVTHAATVLIYFIEKDLWGRPFPGPQEKYLGIAERLVLALCFLLPNPWWAPAAAVWGFFMYWIRAKRVVDFSWFSLAAGSAISFLCGGAGRWVYSN